MNGFYVISAPTAERCDEINQGQSLFTGDTQLLGEGMLTFLKSYQPIYAIYVKTQPRSRLRAELN